MQAACNALIHASADQHTVEVPSRGWMCRHSSLRSAGEKRTYLKWGRTGSVFLRDVMQSLAWSLAVRAVLGGLRHAPERKLHGTLS